MNKQPKNTPTRTSKSVHEQRERVAKVLLGFLAVLLIAGGFATPQIVQAIEFQSRGSFVEELEQQQTQLSALQQENDAVTVLIALQMRESKQLQTELESFVTDHADHLDSVARGELVRLESNFERMSGEAEEFLSSTFTHQAVDKLQQLQESPQDSAAAVQLRQLRAYSWFEATPQDIIDAFEVPLRGFESLPEDLDKMTNAQFSSVKERLEDITDRLRVEQERRTQLQATHQQLQTESDEVISTVKAVAATTTDFADLRDRAERFLYEIDDLEQLRENVLTVANAEAFDYTKDAKLVVSSASDDTDLLVQGEHVGAGVHGLLITRAMHQFFNKLRAVDEEILALEEEAALIEAERLYQLELQRELEEQQRLEEQQNSQQPPPDNGEDEVAPPAPDPAPEPEEPVEPPTGGEDPDNPETP